MPVTISTGTLIFSTVVLPKPQTVVFGARRTPCPHVAPTGSDASIAPQTASLAAESYWLAQPTCRSQFATKSACDCALNAGPFAGFGIGGCAVSARLYAGASTTIFSTLSGCCAV